MVAGCAPPAPPPRAGQGRRLHGEEKALLSSPGIVLVACRRGLPAETRQEGVRGLEWLRFRERGRRRETRQIGWGETPQSLAMTAG